MKIIEHKKKQGLCVAYRCGRRRHSKDRFCPKHRKRWEKENRPVEYTFNFLRSNAKRRGKPFNLTIEEFRGFCEETSYISLKGKHAKAASIDRIDPAKGYSLDNIQVLTLSENGKKGAYENPF